MSDEQNNGLHAQRPRNRLRVSMVCLVTVALTALVWIVFHTHERTFRGKPESWWFTNITYRADDNEVNRWRSYGPDGVQLLIRGLNKGNEPIEQTWAKVWPRLPLALRNKLPAPAPANSRIIRMCAADMLDRLGPDARAAAVPALIHNLQVERQDSVKQIVLGFFETPPKLTEQQKRLLFAEFVRGTQSSDSGVRNNSIVALRQHTNRLDVVMPIMLKALSDSDAGVRLTASKMLNEIDHQAALKAGVVTVVIGCLTNSNPRTDSWVPNGSVLFLGDVRSDPDESVPVLVEALRRPDLYVRGNTAHSLARFGSQARAAVPALLQALKDPELYVRQQATNALKAIDPEALNQRRDNL